MAHSKYRIGLICDIIKLFYKRSCPMIRTPGFWLCLVGQVFLLTSICMGATYQFSPYTTVQNPTIVSISTTISHQTTMSFLTTVSGVSSVQGTTTTESSYDPQISDFKIVDTGTITPPSKWSVVTGVIQQLSNIYGGSIDLSYPKEGTIAILTTGEKTQFFGVNLMSKDDDGIGCGFARDSDLLRFSMNKQLGYWRIDIKKNSTWIPQVGVSSTYSMSTWYRVDFRTTEYPGGYEIAVNGTPFMATADTTWQNAKPFLYCWGNTPSYFKDISYGYTKATTFDRPYSYDSTISINSTWTETSTIQTIQYEPLNLYRLDIQ